MIELEFIGAARTVTGSKHLIRTSRAQVLLDCGMFQGRREEAYRKNRELPPDLSRLDAVVLSHAHIDHSGCLPMLVRSGFRGAIYATPATRDLCTPMLLDTAHLMQSDAEHIERLIQRGRRHLTKFEPLYDAQDVLDTLSRMVSFPYHHRGEVAPGIFLTFYDAGHVLGSATCALDIEDDGQKLRLLYTGDLGRKHLPILRDPEIPEGVEYLLMESTYGDRLHDPIEAMGDSLAEVVARTASRGGKVIIPSFALERAQEVIYTLKKLRAAGRVPNIPVYVDSPLTTKLTDVFKLHPECYGKEMSEILQSHDSPFEFDGLSYVSSVEESKNIDREPGPSIIISASGMCEGGRVLHHLDATIEDPKNTVLIVGYQAEHTLGRRLVEKDAEVRIFGIPHPRRAEVSVLNSFSAHADQSGLIKFAQAVRSRGRLSGTFLVHGEPGAQQALLGKFQELGLPRTEIPRSGEHFRLGNR